MIYSLLSVLLMGLLLVASPVLAKTDGFAAWKRSFAVKLKRQGLEAPAIELFLAHAP